MALSDTLKPVPDQFLDLLDVAHQTISTNGVGPGSQPLAAPAVHGDTRERFRIQTE
jgi:hypothetical protein